MYLRLFFLIILVHLSSLAVGDLVPNQSLENGTFTIKLNRQRTPFEQHLNNAGFLKKHGLNVDWLYKKHHNGTPRTNDSIALYRYLDNEFYGTIVIGHPGQTLNVAFDTAWTLSWVLSSQCYSWTNIGCLFHNKYDHGKSSEYKPDGRKISIPEGNYNLTGFFSYDNISFAHSNVTNFLFAEMTDVPRTMLFSKVDGVLGLGLRNNDPYEPFFYALMRLKRVKEHIFCIYLNRDKQSSHGGNIIIGFLEKRHINHTRIPDTNETIYDKVKYMPIKPGYFWRFDLERVFVNVKKEGPLEFCTNGKCTAITDTSSNNIMGPQEDIDKIHKAIEALPFFLGRYRVDCDTVNKLPVIAFNIGGQNFTLKGRDYTVKLAYMGITVCLSAFVPSGSPNYWVLGGAFLSEYYTIYNVDEKEIGIVKAA